MKSTASTPELLSALADGQLSDEELAAVLKSCAGDGAAMGCWNTYHLIGDVLRSPAAVPGLMPIVGETGFASRLGARLAQEPAFKAMPAQVERLQVPAGIVHHRGPASNDGSFRWKVLAGVASVAAVSAMAWNASGLMAPSAAPQLAQAPSPQILMTSPQGPVVRDARLEELLAAHRQLGTASALQESSGFLRNAAFETSSTAQSTGGR